MTINRIFLFSFLIVIGLGSNSFAQVLTNPQRRDINLQVYSLLEQYSRFGRFSSNYSTIDENYVKQFSSLFDSSAFIFNDILPANKLGQSIHLEDYIALVRKYYPEGNGFRLHNIVLDIPEVKINQLYSLNAYVYKEIYGTTNQNANYRDTVFLTFTIEFRMEETILSGFRITEIGGDAETRTLRMLLVNKKSGTPLEGIPVQFNDAIKHTDKNGRIELGGLNPDFLYNYLIDIENYSIIRQSGFYVDDLIHSKVKPNPEADYFDPNEIIYRIGPMARINLSLHFAPTISESSIKFVDYTWDQPATWTNTSYSRSQDFYAGFKAGYKILHRENIEIIALAGLEIGRYSSNFHVTSYERIFQDLDYDNDECIKRISVDIDQKIVASGLAIPIHFLVMFKHFKHFDINLETGLNLNHFKNYSYTGAYQNGDFFGEYSQYLDQVISEDMDLGFVEDHQVEFEEESWQGNNIPTLYFSPSISKNISRSVQIYGGPAFIFGIGNISGIEEPVSLTKDYHRVEPMTNVAKESKIVAFSFELGIRYRFAAISDIIGNFK